MPYFKNQEEMLAVYRAFFERLAADPQIGPELRKSNLIFRFKVYDPEGLMTINCRDLPEEGKYLSFTFGESALRPDLTLASSADFSHEFWLGKTNVVTALLSGKVRAEGNVGQAVKLMPALAQVFSLYALVLKQLGREDLVIY